MPGANRLREELTQFMVTPTRKGARLAAQGRAHDDLVLALALAVLAAGFAQNWAERYRFPRRSSTPVEAGNRGERSSAKADRGNHWVRELPCSERWTPQWTQKKPSDAEIA